MAFQIHEDLLCNASPVFKSAFAGEGVFKEASQRSMDLIDDDAEDVTRFSQWLYAERYQLEDKHSVKDVERRYMQLATLYVFADKYAVVALMNDIIDKLFELIKDWTLVPPRSVIRYIYENTVGPTPFRALLVAAFTWDLAPGYYSDESNAKELAGIPEFAAELALSLGRRSVRADKSPFKHGSRADQFYTDVVLNSDASSSC